MNLKEKSIKSVFWIGSTKAFGQGISWLLTIMLARLLSPADFGLMAMATIFIAFAEFFNELGLDAAIIQKKDLSNDELYSSFWLILSLSILIFASLFFGAPVVAWFFKNEKLINILKILSFVFILGALRTIPLNILRRELQFKIITTTEFISNILSGFFAVGFAFFGFGVWSLVAGFMARNFLHTVLLLFYKPWKPKLSFSLEKLKTFLLFGLPITGSRLIWYATGHIDYFIIGRVLGDKILGYYRLSLTFGRTPFKKIWMIINRVVLPIFSQLQNDDERLKQYFLKISRYIALIVIPANIGIFLLAKDIINLVLTAKWLPILVPLRVFLILSIFDVMSVLVAPLLNARGKPNIPFKISIINMIIFVPALFVGIHFGLIGILIAWISILPLISMYKISFALKELNLSFFEFFQNLRVPVFCTVCMSGCVITGRLAIVDQFDLIGRLVILCLIGTLSYIFLIWFYPSNYKHEIKDIFKVLVTSLSPKKSSL